MIKRVVPALVSILAITLLTVAAVGMVRAILDPPVTDLIVFAGFLLAAGGVATLISAFAARFAVPGSLMTRFFFAAALTTGLALANVGILAYLMFLSRHDLAVLAASIGFSLGVSVLVAINLAEPLAQGMRHMTDTVRRMNAGNLSTRIPVNGRDEVARLSGEVNAMAERLSTGMNRERTIETARKELIRAVSHDLRTPLASIRGMIESINDGVVTDEATVRRYLRTSQTEVESLTQLVNDLFELSQLDAGALELHIEPSSLQDLVSDTLEAVALQAADKRLRVHGEVDPGLGPVLADPSRVTRVLLNLVHNAMRHTPSDSAIFIRAVDSGPEVEVQVIDTGEGISPPDMARLFERGFRTDPARARLSGGSGLGLSIARGIIEAHGGRIWAQSEVGKGSVFSFTLRKVGVSSAA